MKPSLSLDRSLVAAEGEQIVNCLLELRAPSAPTDAARMPLDLALVIDRSGSMCGEPLEAVKASVLQLLRVLGPDDRCAVVSFDDTVELALPLGHHDVDEATPLINAITDGGSTNLSGGWLKGLEVLEAGRPEAVRRVVLLTDGAATPGSPMSNG
jgi:Ca-activated chloride channel family protein